MKKILLLGSLMAWAATCAAEPIRVVLLDFDDLTGQKADERLGGAVDTKALAGKGALMLAKQLLTTNQYVLIDRRDFIAQSTKFAGPDAKDIRPTYFQAARVLRADVILRGSLQSLSTGKQEIRQGGQEVDLSDVSLRIALEALNAFDGTVIAVSEGVAKNNFRQTQAVKTVLGEEDTLQLMEKAIASALPAVQAAVESHLAKDKNQPVIALSVKTSADPALVEIDGVLVGVTPLEKFTIHRGDHVFTVGKPGYRDVTKRILFEKDTAIEVPMLRNELSADDLKAALDKMRINVNIGEPALMIHTIEEKVAP